MPTATKGRLPNGENVDSREDAEAARVSSSGLDSVLLREDRDCRSPPRWLRDCGRGRAAVSPTERIAGLLADLDRALARRPIE